MTVLIAKPGDQKSHTILNVPNTQKMNFWHGLQHDHMKGHFFSVEEKLLKTFISVC
jgi:hypothetical protein